MKDFFKRIGRGIKKVGRKIGEFFKSGVGKIIGGIMLAVALPQIFSSFFSGSVTTGAGETLQTTLGEKVVGTAKEGVIPQAINNEEAVFKLSRSFKAAAKQTGEIFTSPIDATKRTLDFMTGGKLSSRAGATFEVAEGSKWRGTAFAKPEIGKSINEYKSSIKAGMNESEALESFVNSLPADQQNMFNADLIEKGFTAPVSQPAQSGLPPFGSPDLAVQENWLDPSGNVVSQDKINLYKWEKGLTERAKEKWLQNKDFRKFFDDTTGLTGDTEIIDVQSQSLGFSPADTRRGVSRYTTFSKAPGVVDKALHVYQKSIGEATGYSGPLSERSLLGTSYATVGVGQRLFGKEEEIPSRGFNPYASSQSAKNLEAASAFVTTPTLGDNFYNTLRDIQNVDQASSIIKQAHQNAGYSYVYGAYAPMNRYG